MSGYPTLQILKEFDDSKFKKISKGRDYREKFQILHDNLWSMFDFKEAKSGSVEYIVQTLETKDDRLSVSNFAWTKEVKYKFEKHPYHRQFISYWKDQGGMTWGMFVLDAYPNCTDEEGNLICDD